MARGKRAGVRPAKRLHPGAFLLVAGALLAVAGWAYLVWAAVSFGAKARGGEPHAWAYLALAGVGAMACLFIGLLLGARLLAAIAAPPGALSAPVAQPTPGGRRRLE